MSTTPDKKDDGAAENDTNLTAKRDCRICFASDLNLCRMPCNCSGSVGFVHKSCFGRWMISVRNFDTCEICHMRYDKASAIVPKRNFKNLFMTFFRRPFYALCTFSTNFALAAGIGYLLSSKSQNCVGDFVPLLVACPFIALYVHLVDLTTVSFRNFLTSMSVWWDDGRVEVQMSTESIEDSELD